MQYPELGQCFFIWYSLYISSEAMRLGIQHFSDLISLLVNACTVVSNRTTHWNLCTAPINVQKMDLHRLESRLEFVIDLPPKRLLVTALCPSKTTIPTGICASAIACSCDICSNLPSVNAHPGHKLSTLTIWHALELGKFMFIISKPINNDLTAYMDVYKC